MRDPREQAHIDLVRDATDLQFLVALFDGEIAYMDAMIGRVLSALEARGLADDTLTIVVADHGESIVDHDMFFNHGDSLPDQRPHPLDPSPSGGTARHLYRCLTPWSTSTWCPRSWTTWTSNRRHAWTE